MENTEKLLSSTETARTLKVSKMTISRMVKNGDLNPINTHARFFLFKESEVISLRDYRIENNIKPSKNLFQFLTSNFSKEEIEQFKIDGFYLTDGLRVYPDGSIS
jgi:excisionase family DNA binding protein